MKKINLLYVLSLIVLVFSGCKDDEIPALEYKQQGFIKGKITGTMGSSATAINEDFNYSRYSIAVSSEYYSFYEVNGDYEFFLVRADLNTGGYAYLNFTLSNASDTSPDGVSMGFQFLEERGDDLFTFAMGSSGNTLTITDFLFTESTGRVKGHYVVSGSNNSTAKAATIEGDFDVIVKRRIM